MTRKYRIYRLVMVQEPTKESTDESNPRPSFRRKNFLSYGGAHNYVNIIREWGGEAKVIVSKPVVFPEDT